MAKRTANGTKKRTCFVIAPIGTPNSDTRRRSDQIFKHIIGPTMEPLGYYPVRADHISEPGFITSQVIQRVVDSELVIADLTGHNPNVFYELAIRHVTKSPLIQIIQSGEQIPFDVAGTRTISFDIADLDSVDAAKTDILRQAKSIEKGGHHVETPISIALNLKTLKESEEPGKYPIADILTEALSEVRSSINAIEQKISNPQALIPPQYIDLCFRRFNELASHIRMRMRSDARDLMDIVMLLKERKSLSVKEIENLTEKLSSIANRIDKYAHEI